MTFVERTEAVEVQIGLEETRLRVDEEALESLDGYIREREELLGREWAPAAAARSCPGSVSRSTV